MLENSWTSGLSHLPPKGSWVQQEQVSSFKNGQFVCRAVFTAASCSAPLGILALLDRQQ